MKKSKKVVVGIIDLGISNITSVANAFQKIGFLCKFLNEDNYNVEVDVIILPGVGNFGYLASQLKVSKLKHRILKHHREQRPIIGICLGMQILFDTSDECSSSNGLGLISGTVKKLSSNDSLLTKRSVPNIGYNIVNAIAGESGILNSKLDKLSGYYYFLHSYAVFDRQTDVDLEGVTQFSDKSFVSFFLKKNLCGIQFHPERSGEKGLYFLEQVMEYFLKNNFENDFN